MRRQLLNLLIWSTLLTSLPGAALAADEMLAPTGTLRVVYLAGNAAQAVRDPKTGEVAGVSIDLARELARRAGLPLELQGLAGVQAVIDAVASEKADIGFLAADPSRRGPVEFSQVYLRNPQSLLVREPSPIRTFADIDAPGLRIAGARMDSITLYLKRSLKQAQVVEMEKSQADDVRAAFATGAIDAFGANRVRLTAYAAEIPGLRLLPGSILGVPQAIVVSGPRSERLAAVNAFLGAMRESGFLQAAITRANNGTEIEPAPSTK